MMIPGNRPIERREINCGFFAVNNWMIPIKRYFPLQAHLRLRQISAVSERGSQRAPSWMSPPFHNRSLPMCAVPCSDFLGRGRSKIVEAYAVSCNSCQESSFGKWAKNASMCACFISEGINCLPCRFPHRVDWADRIQNQLTDVTSAFQNRDMPPCAFKSKAGSGMQDVRETSYQVAF